MAIQTNQKMIGVFALAMINTAAIINLNNLPAVVVLGYGLIAYLLLAAIFFFLPTAFVSAELATGWPQDGGFYTWVRTAFGPVIGFLAIWLQWLANVIWYPTLISPMVSNALTVFAPHLLNQNWPLFIIMVSAFWLLTLINLQGIRESSFISSFGVIFGSILPAILIVIFAGIWLYKKLPVYLHFSFQQLFPRIDHLSDLSILVSVLVTLVGMEMSAVHVNNVKNPRTSYPRAGLIAALTIMSTFIITSLAMAVLVAPDKIDLINGVVQCLENFSAAVHMPWLVPTLMIFIILGIMTNASTWILGPSRGLQVAAINSEFPHFFQHKNKHDMPSRILFLQAVIYTLMSSLFIFVPSIASSYWILIALTGQLYMTMYFILFCTGIRLRYKYPNVIREYSIPGRWNLGMWLVGILGLIGTTMAFIVTFYPPAQFSGLEVGFYIKFLIISFSASCVIPMIFFSIYYYYKRRQVDKTLTDHDHPDLLTLEAHRLPVLEIDEPEEKPAK